MVRPRSYWRSTESSIRGNELCESVAKPKSPDRRVCETTIPLQETKMEKETIELKVKCEFEC